MSVESETGFETSNNIEKVQSSSLQDDGTSERIELTAEILLGSSTIASNENSTVESSSLSVNGESSPEFDSAKHNCDDGTDQKHEKNFSSQPITRNDVRSLMEKIRKEMKENELLLEKSLKVSRNFLKAIPKNFEDIASMKRIQEYTNSDDLSCSSEGESESSFEVRKILENKCPLSSGYITLASSESCTPQSTVQSSDSTAQSLSSEVTSGKTSARSDSLETLVSDRPPSTAPSVKVNNSFCHSFMTRRIRKHYDDVFDFEDFKHACSLNSNAFKQFLNIKYIALPIAKFLMEDLLDFIDFFNGTGVELRESESNQCPSTPEDRKLAFVRDNFDNGVQQMESRTISNLLEEVVNFIYEQPTCTEESSNSTETTNSIEPPQIEAVLAPETESKCSDSKEPSGKSYLVFSMDRYRIIQLDRDIENMDDPFVAERLESLNESIRRLMMRCISDTRMVLELCMNSKYSILKLRLKKYLAGIRFMLHRLVMLREDSVMLLEKCGDQMENFRMLYTLKVKIQIATVFQALLAKLFEINSEFLEN